MILAQGDRDAVRIISGLLHDGHRVGDCVRHFRRIADRGFADHAERAHPHPPGRPRILALHHFPLVEGAPQPMTRTHRAWHRIVWIGLAIAVGLGFGLALALRPAPAAAPGPVMERAR